MPLHQRIKYASSIIFLLGIAAICFVKLHQSPGDSLFNDFVPACDGKLWTVIGSTDSNREAYVGLDGAVQPGKQAYAVHWYVYDKQSHHLIDFSGSKRSLLDGYLPAPIAEWSDKAIHARIMSFVDNASDMCWSSLKIKNISGKSRKLKIFIAAVPYGVTGKMQSEKGISYNPKTRILKAGYTQIHCDQAPQGFGTTRLSQNKNGKLVDITSYIIKGRLPRQGNIESISRKNSRKITKTVSGAVGYEIEIKPNCTRTLSFRSPIGSRDRVSRKDSYTGALKRFKDRWNSQLSRVKLSLPDKRYVDCFYASLAYLMILSDDGAPRPGSAIYEPFWIRDNVYIADAYYYAGRLDLASQSLEQLAKMQVEDGGFTPHTASARNSEHDAPGQAIYIFLQHYRRTGDTDYLKKTWPIIESAAGYINKLLVDRKSILPPSMSAEDLGSEKQQHYWDDFWAVRGLRDASFAAKALGKTRDADKFQNLAQLLLDATWKSIRKVAKDHSIQYIPNGPEDIESSAMARGTSCGIWPCGVLEPSDPFVVESFDVYWNKWIKKCNGGFEHKAEFWPYAGLDLAMDYLMLGQYERSASILRWSINHDPTGGFYSWPEGMNVKDYTLAAGDMPHGWMCAAYINLIRNMLVRESDSELIIASGVPREWLSPGRSIEIKNFPTLYGPISYILRAFDNRLELSINSPKAKYCRIVLPSAVKIIGLEADGRELSSFSADRCTFPAASSKITLRIKR
jgi:GH15 family glucan-1,4-alpha-glucosidase